MKYTMLCLVLLSTCLPPGAAQTSRPARPAVKPAPVQPRPAVHNGPFSDVPKNHWAAAAVETLRQRGIVTGYPAGKPGR